MTNNLLHQILSEFDESSDLDDSEAMEFERLKIEGVKMMEIKV